MSGWGPLIHNFLLFSDFLHHGVCVISVHLIKGYIGKLLSLGVWVCREACGMHGRLIPFALYCLCRPREIELQITHFRMCVGDVGLRFLWL